jgi:hypothetical protein
MIRSKASLLLFALSGCLHRSPDGAVLAPLVAYLTEEPSDQSNQPEYIVFADQLTATVFESLKRNAHYRITPIGTRLVCPSNPAPEPNCYSLRARVIKVRGDSAIASIERRYLTFSSGPEQVVLVGTVVYAANFLLVRRSGKWRLEKRINASVMMAG